MDIKILSQKFKVRDAEDAVIGAVEDAVNLRTELATITGVSQDTNKAILASAAALVKSHKDHLALCEALGADKPEDAIVKLTELQKTAKAWAESEAELKQLRDDQAKRDAAQAEADVKSVIAVQGLPESTYEALLSLRTNNPEKFAETYPPVTDQQKKLTQRLTQQGDPPKGNNKDQAANVIDLAEYPGNNKAERAIAYLSGKSAQFSERPWEEQCRMAHNLIRRPNVVDSVADAT